MVDWTVRGVWAVAMASLVLLVADALPTGWLLDLDEGGTQGLVRCVAVVTWIAALMQLTSRLPAHEVWESGFAAGRRAAQEARLDSQARG